MSELLPATREHLACIRADILKYHVCRRQLLAGWVGDIRRKEAVPKKTAKMALANTPEAGIKWLLLFMDKL